MKRREYKKVKKQVSGKRLAFKISLLVALSLFLGIASYALSLYKKAESAADQAYEVIDNRKKSNLRDDTVEPVNDNVSILFIGVDGSSTRGDDNTRSDALLVATLNKKQKTVKLLSIPRDSYVYIPKINKKDKINHAHAFGGVEGTIDTIEEMLDIPIDYYVKMNFNAFIEVVDALGGIEAEVPYNIVEMDEFDRRTVQLNKGIQQLNGKEALALARTRRFDSDLERGKRQQMILQSIMKEAFTVKSITKYGDVIDAVGNNMKTNMTFDEMKSFLDYAKGGIPQVTTLTLTGHDDWPISSYYYLDEKNLEQNKLEMQTHLEFAPNTKSLSESKSGVSDTSESADEGSYNN